MTDHNFTQLTQPDFHELGPPYQPQMTRPYPYVLMVYPSCPYVLMVPQNQIFQYIMRGFEPVIPSAPLPAMYLPTSLEHTQPIYQGHNIVHEPQQPQQSY